MAARPGLEQGRIALELGVDRTTMADVSRRLEERGMVVRSGDPADRRTRRLALTARGQDLVGRMAGAAERTHARLMEPLDPEARAVLTALLCRLLDSHNDQGRVPMRRT